jgi:hypothetical protein
MIDPSSDYLPDQLRFFLNQLILKMKTMRYIRFLSYQDNCEFAKIRARARLTSRHIRTTLMF